MSWDDITDKFSSVGEGIGNFAKRLFGSENEREVRKLTPLIAEINGLETWAEAKVILIFHIVGTVMELFKTAAGSWIIPTFGPIRANCSRCRGSRKRSSWITSCGTIITATRASIPTGFCQSTRCWITTPPMAGAERGQEAARGAP